MICEFYEVCAFFDNRFDEMPKLAGFYKDKYCTGDKRTCARYMVIKLCGKSHLPKNLFPNQPDKAEKIIREH